jgi:topoisomerase-4 subunit B
MAKSATKKNPPLQRDLFDSPKRAAKPAARKPTPRTPAKESARKATRSASAESGYTAKHIEVLEGLEPVRRRPVSYCGGTDEKALHPWFAEVIDTSMAEALAGLAHRI